MSQLHSFRDHSGRMENTYSCKHSPTSQLPGKLRISRHPSQYTDGLSLRTDEEKRILHRAKESLLHRGQLSAHIVFT